MTVDTSRYVHSDDGHDGSHYQPDAGPMDLAVLHAIPMDWLGWKTTQSDKGVDRSFAGVDAVAEQIGFRWFLPYGWLSSTTDPHAQADNYLVHCGKIRSGKGAMIDAEEKGITVAKVVAKAERIEEEFKRPASIYTGLYVAGGTIWRSEEVRNSAYGLRPMHLAAYVTRANLLQRLTDLGLLELAMHMWQWSSNGILTTGQHLPGITGRADLNTVVTPSMMDLACGITSAPIPKPLPIPVPQPSTEDVMLRLLAPTDSDARFYADVDPPGRARRCEWTGDGTDPAVQARIKFYADAHPKGGEPFELAMDVAGLINVSLDGALPPGFKAEQFGNPDEIIARLTNVGGVDSTARAQILALNDAVGRVGQRQSTAGKAMADAGAALLGS